MPLSNQIRVIAENIANQATLTATPSESAVASMPVTNLQNSNRTKSFRTLAIGSGGFAIQLEWSARKRISAVVLYGHNLKVGDTWRIKLWSGPAHTGSLTTTPWAPALVPKTAGELNWGVDQLTATVFDDWSGLAYSVLWFGSVAAQSAEIEIISNGNPDGFAEINQLVMGQAMAPSRNFSFGYELSYFQTSSFELTEGGSTKVQPGVAGRVIALTLGRITGVERSAWADFLRLITQHQELFISLFPEQGGKLERDYSMVCMVPSPAGLKNVNALRYTLSQSFQEI